MMTRGVDVALMRAAVGAGRVEWHRHALERMMEREISRHDVLWVLSHGECIEVYAGDYPLPSALFLGHISGRPFHVVAALNSARGTVAVVTTYEPDSVRFEEDFKTRKKL